MTRRDSRYDHRAAALIAAGIAARTGRGRAAMWVESPAAQFRDLDDGGRTLNERTLTRAIYYQTWRAPINAGEPVLWSPRLTWGKIEKHGSRWGRMLHVQVFTYAAAKRRQDRLRAQGRPGWRDDTAGTGQWPAGRSVSGRRIDQAET